MSLACPWLAGCAATGPRPVWDAPIAFGQRAGAPHVLVYGSLIHLLPHFDDTPALDLFLYGPSDAGKTMLRNPQGMALLGQTLLVCDQGRPDVIAIDLSTGRSSAWTDPQRRPRCPVDICTDDGVHVFVADTSTRSVLLYDAGGRFIQELFPPEETMAAATDAPAVRTFRPTAVRFAAPVLYVANMGNHRIDRYDVTSQHWLPPPTTPPDYLRVAAPTGLDIGPDGTLHIVDSVQQRVLRMTRDGQWLPPIGAPGRMAGQFVRPKSVCVTASGLILVTDAGRQSIQVFDANGNDVTELHESGPWSGLTLPAGILRLGSVPALRTALQERNWTPPGETIVISDAMGGMPLILAGVSAPESEASARGQ